MIENSLIIWLAAGTVGVIILAALILNFVEWHRAFSGELKHINSEIERTDGRERAYWKKKKKRLLLSLLPFFKY